jgi:hypothetical protein
MGFLAWKKRPVIASSYILSLIARDGTLVMVAVVGQSDIAFQMLMLTIKHSYASSYRHKQQLLSSGDCPTMVEFDIFL